MATEHPLPAAAWSGWYLLPRARLLHYMDGDSFVSRCRRRRRWALNREHRVPDPARWRCCPTCFTRTPREEAPDGD